MKPSPVSEFPQRAAELPLSPACPGGFSFRTVFITGPSFQDEDALYFGSGLFPTARFRILTPHPDRSEEETPR